MDPVLLNPKLNELLGALLLDDDAGAALLLVDSVAGLLAAASGCLSCLAGAEANEKPLLVLGPKLKLGAADVEAGAPKLLPPKVLLGPKLNDGAATDDDEELELELGCTPKVKAGLLLLLLALALLAAPACGLASGFGASQDRQTVTESGLLISQISHCQPLFGIAAANALKPGAVAGALLELELLLLLSALLEALPDEDGAALLGRAAGLATVSDADELMPAFFAVVSTSSVNNLVECVVVDSAGLPLSSDVSA